MSEFSKFAAVVHAQFAEMSKGELFTVPMASDTVWEQYLAAFPAGSNPVFRERTEHDCSCCRNFIKNIGNVVSIKDGKLISVWDVEAEYPYNEVAAALSAAVKVFPVSGLFRASERSYGAAQSKELRADGTVHTWNHFHGQIAAKHFTQSVGQVVGDYATTTGVFKRGLDELTADAFKTAIDLIEAKQLYRGDEHLASLKAFQALQRTYIAISNDGERSAFIWSQAGQPAARFRNTAIGTLIQDLSEGMSLEQAVKSFEQKVAPTNYKRPTAIITPRMVKDAMKTINELGLQPALERRYARFSDISVNNVLWVDNSVQGKMKDGIESLLMDAATAPVKAPSKAEDITMDDFMTNVLPEVQSMDVLVKNSQQGNFMSITAPTNANSEPLFKWGNDFAWSYAGEVTDSIKERVKAAGGTVEGDLCCRLAWEYRDDLDFHMKEPNGGHIHFGNRRRLSPNGGMLDLDANGADGQRDDPAENIFYTDRRKMANGVYTLQVHNYSRRSDGKGFVVQIEFDGQVHNINYEKVLRSSDTVTVAKIQNNGGVFTIIESLPSSQTARNVWGVPTETFIKVNTLMQSPNHWDGERTGNKHWFFLLDGCRNPDATRGIYNEFLSSNLEKHRKVFEVLGDRTKCQPTDDQLSGVGFSSTRGDSVMVNVIGAKIRKTYNITF